VWIFYDYIEDPHFARKAGDVQRSVVCQLQQPELKAQEN